MPGPVLKRGARWHGSELSQSTARSQKPSVSAERFDPSTALTDPVYFQNVSESHKRLKVGVWAILCI